VKINSSVEWDSADKKGEPQVQVGKLIAFNELGKVWVEVIDWSRVNGRSRKN